MTDRLANVCMVHGSHAALTYPTSLIIYVTDCQKDPLQGYCSAFLNCSGMMKINHGWVITLSNNTVSLGKALPTWANIHTPSDMS